MGGVRAADLRRSRDETLKTVEARASDLSRIVSAYLAETFAAGDASLRQLALHGRRVGGANAPGRQWLPSLASARAGLTSIGAISVVDRDGIIRHTTRTEILGQSRRDDYIFRQAITAPNDDLIIGTPLTTVVEPRQLVIPIGRRLTLESGEIDGAVVASFITASARGFFETIDVGRRGSVWVFHPSGVVLFREPGSTTASIGDSALANPIFIAATRSGAGGVLREPVESGDRMLVSAFHTSSRPPFIAAVSFDQDEVLEDWWHEAAASAAVFGVVALTLAATLIVLFRQMDAKAEVELALARAQQLEAERLREANDRLASALRRESSARREAEAASELKDQFLMTVSHELRTPLTAIYGWARMLADGAVSDRQKEAALRTIERNAHAQTRLIDDLLDVSRVMGGKLRLDVRTLDAADVVQNAVDTIGPAAAAKGIRLETVIDPGTGRVAGDPERLQQIVWNLLSNAVKFTPAGGHVVVAVQRVHGDVEIAVRDNGIGISPEFLPHVFERFRQEDAGTKRRFGGLGLGLAIVRNLVELHGGSVEAHSDGPGRGATFVVRLPAPTSAPSPAKEAREAERIESLAKAKRLDGIRVLVADDDPEARTLFGAILEGAGATVACAPSAEAAMATLRSASYDVLVCDIEMPDVDGYALLKQALSLAHSRGDRLMAVAVTAYSRPEDETRSLEAGFHRHVQKPVDPPALIATVVSVWNTALRDSA